MRSRIIDVGCGPQGVLHVLANQVGPTGTVVGLERDTGLVALARAFVAAQGFPNVEVVQGDARHDRVDRFVGRRLASLMRAAGLVGVQQSYRPLTVRNGGRDTTPVTNSSLFRRYVLTGSMRP